MAKIPFNMANPKAAEMAASESTITITVGDKMVTITRIVVFSFKVLNRNEYRVNGAQNPAIPAQLTALERGHTYTVAYTKSDVALQAPRVFDEETAALCAGMMSLKNGDADLVKRFNDSAHAPGGIGTAFRLSYADYSLFYDRVLAAGGRFLDAGAMDRYRTAKAGIPTTDVETLTAYITELTSATRATPLTAGISTWEVLSKELADALSAYAAAQDTNAFHGVPTELVAGMGAKTIGAAMPAHVLKESRYALGVAQARAKAMQAGAAIPDARLGRNLHTELGLLAQDYPVLSVFRSPAPTTVVVTAEDGVVVTVTCAEGGTAVVNCQMTEEARRQFLLKAASPATTATDARFRDL